MTLVSLKPLAGIPGGSLLRQGIEGRKGASFLTLSFLPTQPNIVVLLVGVAVQPSLDGSERTPQSPGCS